MLGVLNQNLFNYETTLVNRKGVFYTNDTNKPYSGPVFSLYDDGKKKEEGNFKDGKSDGVRTEWNWNGQKGSEGNYRDGKQDGKATIWHENGQKSDEVTYKDGELISEKCWDEDGNECECRAFSSGCY